MKIYLGTTSETKIAIVKEGLLEFEPYTLLPVEVDSGITDQPLDEKITILGSENRARNAIAGKTYDLGIGLEGGLIKLGDLFHLICVASVVDPSGNIFIGESKKLPLPKEVSKRIANGEQFGTVIREFQKNIGDDYPPQVYELIEELIARRKSFLEALSIALLKFRFRKNLFQI